MTNIYKLVPLEPTDEMIESACIASNITDEGAKGWIVNEYKAMLKAAPLEDVELSTNVEIKRLRDMLEAQADKDAKRIAKLEKRCEDLDERNNTQAIYIDNYIAKVSELEKQNAELVKALQNHGRHLADCTFLPNWIDHECNCGLFKLLAKKGE